MHRKWVVSADYRAIVDTLRAVRIEAGISQRQLAARLGKPPSFVNKIELIERRIDVLEFVAYAKAVGLSPSVLIDKIAQALPDKINL